MKNKALKIITDIVLTVLFVFLFGLFFTGRHIHEILGKVTAGIIVLHLIINFKWLRGVTTNLFSKGFPSRIKIIYILNFLIFAGIITIILTGISMSDPISAGQMSLSVMKTRFLHTGVSYITLGVIGIHIGLHISQISRMFSKVCHPSKKVSQTLTIITVIVFLSLGAFGLVKADYFKRTKPVMSTEMVQMFEMMESGSNTQLERPTHKPPANPEQKEESNQSRNVRHNSHMKIIYVLLSLVFFITLTYSIDKLFSLKKNKPAIK